MDINHIASYIFERADQRFGSAAATGPARLLLNYRAISGKTRIIYFVLYFFQ
jgi:hypothetical protein